MTSPRAISFFRLAAHFSGDAGWAPAVRTYNDSSAEIRETGSSNRESSTRAASSK
jgi:hypothetical protein